MERRLKSVDDGRWGVNETSWFILTSWVLLELYWRIFDHTPDFCLVDGKVFKCSDVEWLFKYSVSDLLSWPWCVCFWFGGISGEYNPQRIEVYDGNNNAIQYHEEIGGDSLDGQSHCLAFLWHKWYISANVWVLPRFLLHARVDCFIYIVQSATMIQLYFIETST